MFSISAHWEQLTDGELEERAAFAATSVLYGNHALSEGHDPFNNRLRSAPYLSAYHLAEWLMANWWRLRWEPRRTTPDWGFAHRMASIGAGYIWPNITMFSDGERVAIVANPTEGAGEHSYRYIADMAAVVPAADFENAIERFVEQVVSQLDAKQLRNTNLHLLRADVAAERHDPDLSRHRKLEALMGYDADEAPHQVLTRLREDERQLGENAVSELAAAAQGDTPLGADALATLAGEAGFISDPRNRFRPADWNAPSRAQTPAWVLGKQAARVVRRELNIEIAPLGDRKLAELGAVAERAIREGGGGAPFAYTLRKSPSRSRTVFRSRWRTARRFELARLIGDHIIERGSEPLVLATRAGTYAQKAQRAFAAELLCPFEGLEDYLVGDYSDEGQEAAAEHFDVSPLTIGASLANHGRIARHDVPREIDLAA